MNNLEFELVLLERRLHQARQAALQAELSGAGLREVGHPMLLCILALSGEGCAGRKGQNQRELARRLNVSPAAVTASLNSLERKGYLLRQPERGDARCNRVVLTERGVQAVEQCRACLERVSRRMYAGLSAQERAVMRSCYLRMLDNLAPEEG